MSIEQFLSSLAIGLVGVFVGGYIQRTNEKYKFFREKRLDKYSEFLVILASEYERAKTLASAMVTSPTEMSDEMKDDVKKLEQTRHSNREALLRLSYQIQILEADHRIKCKVKELADSQPFMAYPFPVKWGQGSYNERFEKFEAEIALFKKNVEDLLAIVSSKFKSPYPYDLDG